MFNLHSNNNLYGVTFFKNSFCAAFFNSTSLIFVASLKINLSRVAQFVNSKIFSAPPKLSIYFKAVSSAEFSSPRLKLIPME